MQTDLFDSLKEPSSKRLFFDIETKYLAHEVGGWQNLKKLGVSCAVIYREDRQCFEHFKEEQLDKMWAAFDSADCIIGFNIHRFDLPVLQPYMTQEKNWKTLDLIENIEKKLGHRLSLEHLARHNLNAQKLGSGVEAVTWYRNKNWEKLLKYCEQDVAITRDLYYLAKRQGTLTYQNRDGKLCTFEPEWG